MKKQKAILILLSSFLFISTTRAQYWPGDRWYNNPLGFEPLKLHTSMGFIVPAVAVGACLIFTKKDPSLKQKLSIYNETGLSWGYKYPHTFLPQNNTGINFQLRKFMSIGAEFDVYFPRDDFNKTTGFAIRPFARFYPVNKSNWQLYFESGGGFIYLLEEFPKPTDQDNRLGTHLNGTTKYGIGSTIDVSKNYSIMFGQGMFIFQTVIQKALKEIHHMIAMDFLSGFQKVYKNLSFRKSWVCHNIFQLVSMPDAMGNKK